MKGTEPASVAIYERANRIANLLAKGAILSMGTTIALAVLAPLGIALSDYLRGDYSDDSWILPFKMRLPWMDVSQTPGYQIGFLLGVVLGASVYVCFTTAEMIFCGACLFLAACLKDLRLMIGQIADG